MIRTFAFALAACLALAGCAGSYASPEPGRPTPGICDAGAVQSYVGQQASGDAGTAILTGSKARALRWGPPNSAWTMDYREDRVNVRYDAGMAITAITCG
jgi:hypothetical protein